MSGRLTKAPCEAPAMHGRHVYKGIAGSVLHTFVLLSGMRAGLFRLCYARSMPLLFAPRSASRLWACRLHCRSTSRLWAYRLHCRSASRLWACRLHCRGPLRVHGYAARITDSLRVRGHAARIAGSLRVRRDRGDAVSLTLRLCLPRVLPVSTLRDV